MFGFGFTELLLIAVVILLVVGPKRLPDVARSIGKGYGEFKRSFNDFKQSVDVTNITSNTTSSNNKNNNSNSGEKPHEQYVDKYKSQWEKKVSKNELEDKAGDMKKSSSSAKSDNTKKTDS